MRTFVCIGVCVCLASITGMEYTQALYQTGIILSVDKYYYEFNILSIVYVLDGWLIYYSE